MMMTNASNSRLSAAEFALRAATLATERARSCASPSGPQSVEKDDASPVTVADFASQVVVARALTRLLGSAPMLGEETDTILRDPQNRSLLDQVVAAAQASEPAMSSVEVLTALSLPMADPRHGACWTLDPVDGTKGFLRGGHYAIALAWLEGGTPVEGAMACPVLDLNAANVTSVVPPGVIALAARGQGARVSSLGDNSFRPLVCNNWKRGDPIRLALSFEAAHGNADVATELAGRVGDVSSCVRVDSSGKYVLVAAGRADAYLRIPRDIRRAECVWDHAAGVCIAREAGCVACDLDGNELDFGRGPTLNANRGVIVAPPRLAEALVAFSRS